MIGDSTASPELDRLPRSSRADVLLDAIDSALPSRTVILRYAAPAIIGVAALTLLWSRLIMIDQSVWGDEAFSIYRYIDVGPTVLDHTAALRPLTPDGMPLIGVPSGWQNVSLALGGGRKGMLLASAMGRAAADLLGTGHTDLAVAPCAPERFDTAGAERVKSEGRR